MHDCRQVLVVEGKSKLEYLEAVIKETLRLHPPGPLFPRESRQRCQISGYEFPAKMKVIINEWAIGRDPDSWVEAETFKPERFLQGGSDSDIIDFIALDFKFSPFGAGRRSCPGISFGLSVIQLALSQLLYHFDWELANGIKPDDLDMSETFGFTCRRKNALYLIATPRSSSSSFSSSMTSTI